MNIDPQHLEYTQAIIPTVLIPLTMISVGISIVASFIAALFGVELKAEGPKRLLEVLLKPKVLLSALIFNLCVYGVTKVYIYQSTKPRPVFWLKWVNSPKPSDKIYINSNLDSYQAQVGDRTPENFKEPKLLWSQTLPKGGFRPPTLAGETFFVSSFDKKVYEMDFQSGENLRYFSAGAPVSVEPLVYKGHVYFGEGVHETHQAKIYSYSLKTGALEQYYKTAGHIEAHAQVTHHNGKDILITPSGKGGLYALELPDLKLLWNQEIGHTDSPVLIDDGVVYGNTGREKHNPDLFRSYATALDLESGKVLWKRELPVSAWYQPVLYDQSICFPLGEVYFTMLYGGVDCYNKKTGDFNFNLRMNGPVVALPLVTEKGIILATSYGEVCLWGKKTRQRIWCTQVGEGKKRVSYTNPVYDSQRGWVLYPFGKKLYILNPHDGKVIRAWEPETKVFPTYSSVVVFNQSWLIYSKKGTLARFIFE